MRDRRPGNNHQRLLRLMRDTSERCSLRLDGLTVVTEAASGPYVVTPVLAAMAGARNVYAVTRQTRYGTVKEIADDTQALAALAGVSGRIQIRTEKTCEMLEEADVVTNSGHLRPLDDFSVGHMRADAVIPLMYEAWEYRKQDLDLEACRSKGILVGGTNERHQAIDVFSFLGPMAIRLLFDAGVPVYRSHILLLCDNPFGAYMNSGLTSAGARVHAVTSASAELAAEPYDAVVVAMQPRNEAVVTTEELQRLAAHSPGVVLAQYWGDLDRRAVAAAGLLAWPEAAPIHGHMGVLPSAVGPDPIVRLQTGGLKAAEVMVTRAYRSDPAAAEFVELM